MKNLLLSLMLILVSMMSLPVAAAPLNISCTPTPKPTAAPTPTPKPTPPPRPTYIPPEPIEPPCIECPKGDTGAKGDTGEKGETGNVDKSEITRLDNNILTNSNDIYRNNIKIAELTNYTNKAHKSALDRDAGLQAMGSVDFSPDHKGLSLGIGFGTVSSFDGSSNAGAIGAQYGLDEYEDYDIAVNVKGWRTSSDNYGIGVGAVIGF